MRGRRSETNRARGGRGLESDMERRAGGSGNDPDYLEGLRSVQIVWRIQRLWYGLKGRGSSPTTGD